MKRLVVIDGKSVFYRGYYAMGALAKSDGTPTGGVYGFAAIAMELVKRFKPDKVAVAWDKAGTSTAKRTKIFKDYKAGRVKPPEDFFAQIPALRELIEALGWGFLEADEYEADDIIGTLARQVASFASGLSLLVPFDDRSSSGPSLRAEASLSSGRYPADVVEKKLDRRARSEDLSPRSLNNDQCVPYEMFIISSDLDMLQVVSENVKMVRLLKGFTELEEIDVKAIEEKYGIEKSQFLDLKALKGDNSDNIPGVPGIGEKGAVKLLNQFGTLEGVYEHIEEITGATKKKLIEGKESAFMSKELATIMTDAPVSLEEIPELEIDTTRILEELRKLEFKSLERKFLKWKKEGFLDKVKEENATWDAENAQEGLEGQRGIGARVGARGGLENDLEGSGGETGGFRGFRGENLPELPKDTIFSFDVKGLMHKSKAVAKKILGGAKFYDLGQGRFLLDPLARKTEDSPLLLEDEEEMRREYWRQQREFEKYPKLKRVFLQLDLPMIPVLYKIEKKGMKIDFGYFKELEKGYEAQLAELTTEIYKLAGMDFNVNSTIQLSYVLFRQLELPTKGIKKTQKGFSTGAKELEKLKDLHPIVPKIIEYRELAKLVNTYVVPLPNLADIEGRVHTTFTQDVTATGRLSSLNPNLQNIPTRTEEGKKIRGGFIVDPGKVMISADYAQFELRLAAALSGDEALVEDFNSGTDIHTKTAAEVYGIEMKEVTKAQRRLAKVVNFGIIYGMSAKGLADATGMTVGEAKEFVDHYFELRKPIREQLNKYLEQARKEGFVETYFGRRRPTPDVRSANFVVRLGAERAAQNMPIQGTEADLVKLAMIRLDKELPEGAEMIMQVHDSIMVEVSPEKAEETKEVMKRVMEGVAPEFKVKLEVDVKEGKNWGEV
ncbi:hypothetical protein IKG02_01130 [Candidatus Saccharibacteria bacterium]|nr:hypothetical protein [Candidatus Saccharibacteria bacterium]